MGDGSEGSGAFVGRHGPRARIRAAFRDSLTGKARLVLVSGESGIGKTALLTEAVREAAGAGATTAWGTCWDAERAPGYWPWAQVVRQMVDRSEAEILDAMSDDDRADLAQLVPDLGGGPPTTVEELDSGRAQFRFFDAVARWLERSARQRPVVIGFDDLQWADGSPTSACAPTTSGCRACPWPRCGSSSGVRAAARWRNGGVRTSTVAPVATPSSCASYPMPWLRSSRPTWCRLQPTT